MDLPAFLVMVILVSLSGVMAPGPLFATALAEGRKHSLSGVIVSTGHAVVEIPLILTLYAFGLTLTIYERRILAITGGVVMLYLAYIELKSGESRELRGGSLFAGAAMTALNPYFIMWWLTVGLTLITKSVEFGLAGLVLFIFAHEMCDYVWLGFISAFSGKIAAIGERLTKVMTAISVSLLIVFGFVFIYAGVTNHRLI
ncbi:MAG: lysine transporter LysE [Archaeoglobus sp.]|nr:MAG: lysine transporter LysE [Archaeoglobus sp.]